MKTRILIRAHTVRRDIGMSSLVANGLQQLGHDTFICGVHNFQRVMRWWKPHVVITQTAGSAFLARQSRPDALVIFLDAEGYQPEYNTWALFWKRNIAYYKALDLILAWGPALSDEVRQLMPDEDQSKVQVVSSPKFDLVSHMKQNAGPIASRKSVGIITRYPSVNNHEGIPTIRGLHLKSNVDSTINSCLAYHAQHNIISKILRETDFDVSIRPHPLEDVSSYRRYVIPSFGTEYKHRISIDDSLEISEWINAQRALISPTSTAYVEAYILGVPFINVDCITGMYDYNAEYAVVCREWLESAFVPGSIDEAVKLVVDAPELSIQRPMMDEQIRVFCGLPVQRTSTAQVVEAIDKKISQRGTSRAFSLRMPMRILQAADDLIYMRHMRRDRRLANFHYNWRHHPLPAYVHKAFENISREIGRSR